MNFMDKLTAVLEKTLMPVAAKIGSQRHLIALRDGFINTLTASLAGSMAVMINCVFFLPDGFIGRELAKLDFWKESIFPFLDKWIIPIGWQVQGGTLKVISLLLTITIAYSLARSYEVDPLATALISFSSYIAVLPGSVKGLFKLDDKGAYVDGGGGLLPFDYFGSTAMFAAIIVTFIASEIFIKITKKGIVIRMPEQVPPAVSKSFAAIIPGCITFVIFGTIGQIFNSDAGVGKALPTWILNTLQEPLMNLGQSPFTMIFLIFIAQFLWFFGLHGMNIVESVLSPMYAPALLANTDAVAAGKEPQYALTRNFIDCYAMPGGSGGTLALLIAIFIFSKKQENKELAKLAIAPGIFQINEPVIFGLPIVLNVTYFVPFILSSPLMVLIAWIFTEKIHFADYIVVSAPWTTPHIASAFIATNGDIKAAILAAGTLVFAILLYAPFVIAANKLGSSEEA